MSYGDMELGVSRASANEWIVRNLISVGKRLVQEFVNLLIFLQVFPKFIDGD